MFFSGAVRGSDMGKKAVKAKKAASMLKLIKCAQAENRKIKIYFASRLTAR
ncbi:hypothetical protein CCP3SC15_1410005 [Gammaproteobacteria bacterium]